MLKVLSWGSNSHGQLGTGINAEQFTSPTEIDLKHVILNEEIQNITGGGGHSLILTTSGRIYVCGNNDKDQLGIESNLSNLLVFQPLNFLKQIKIIQVSCGWDFNLVVADNYCVYGWGSNSYGQLGLPRSSINKAATPLRIPCEAAVEVATGLRHSCLLSLAHLVYSTGDGKRGQLGNCSPNFKSYVDSFKKVPQLKDVSKVACGQNHSLALSERGSLFAWGDNKYGQLGQDPNKCTQSIIPCDVENLKDTTIKNIFCGWTHSSVLTLEGKLFTWGRNTYGQLGREEIPFWKPHYVSNVSKIVQFAPGSEHSVALTEHNEVLTWGWNEHGNCGDGKTVNIYKPSRIPFGENIKCHVIGSGNAHSFIAIK